MGIREIRGPRADNTGCMRIPALVVAALLFLLPARHAAQQTAALVPLEKIADGVELHRLDDPSLLDPAGPVAVQALRLDPKKVTLEMAVANDKLPARETVPQIAARRGAIAAINAGFFVLGDGAPAAMLKMRGQLIQGTSRPRGAVGFTERRGAAVLLFDRLTVEKTKAIYHPRLGSSAKDWARASGAVSGAGLLLLNGREFTDWTEERIAAGFDTTRHPRTMIGEGGGAIWLVTIDGRQPALSLGMNFTEMKRLARRLGIRSALNLDGGGSTTMVVKGSVVNHPSDAAGPRAVSDAILVRLR
jgi:exopolysaccharide biosynthesis protein